MMPARHRLRSLLPALLIGAALAGCSATQTADRCYQRLENEYGYYLRAAPCPEGATAGTILIPG